MLDGYIRPLDLRFFDGFVLAGLNQWVKEGTFVDSGNFLDLVLTTEDDCVGDVQVLPPFPRCHHCPVVFQYFLQYDNLAAEADTTSRLWFSSNYE